VRLVVATAFLALLVTTNVAGQVLRSVVEALVVQINVNYQDGSSAVTTDECEDVAAQVESEGVVLLQNDGVLPLDKSHTNVNVFGWASTDWLGGGSGSGGVKTVDTDLLKALSDYGIKTNTELTKMYDSFASERQYKAALYCYPEQLGRLYEPSITDTNYYTAGTLARAKWFSDTAIVVIGRQAGESGDVPKSQYKATRSSRSGTNIVEDDTRTSLELSTEEEALLTYVGANFDKVVVVLNTGNAMSVGALETIPGIDAVVDVGLTGQDAASAIPSILYGDVSPSGRTTDTWAYDPSTNPSYANTGMGGVGAYTDAEGLYPDDGSKMVNVGDASATYDQVSYVDYSEGIYVGYKWYETADAEGYWDTTSNAHGTGYDAVVQYPFGYGLSYTSFDWEVLDAPTSLDPDGTLSFTVRVTNVGDVAGADVVELYSTPPYTRGGIERSSVELAGHARTPTLDPGASCEVTITVDPYDLAAYDCYDADGDGFSGYELEAGDYAFSLRRDAHTPDDSAGSTTTLSLASTHHYEVDPTTGEAVTNRFTGDDAVDGVASDGAGQGVTYLSRADFAGTFPQAPTGRDIPDDVAALNRYTAADADAAIDPDDSAITTGASNGEQIEQAGLVTSLGLQLGADYDDPAWDSLLDELSIDDMTNLCYLAYSGTSGPESIGKEETHEADGPAQIGSYNPTGVGTGFPSVCTLASTWDVDLARKEGQTIASQALSLGYAGWYAPTANLHRSPLGGRNYEYYSEDSLLTGEMCGSVVSGSLDMGVYCYVKHFVCDDCESDIYRDGVYTWVTEQALRENYLEPFRIAVERYGATGIMSSYNRIGAVWAGGSGALITDVLRGEWGFDGAVTTDFTDHQSYMNGDQSLRAGGSLWMGVNVRFTGETSSNTYKQHLRNAAHQVLYMYLNARVANQAFVSSSADNARWARPSLTRGSSLVYAATAVLLLWAIFAEWLAIRAVMRDHRMGDVTQAEASAAAEAAELETEVECLSDLPEDDTSEVTDGLPPGPASDD
jgi:beta-glucosidase